MSYNSITWLYASVLTLFVSTACTPILAADENEDFLKYSLSELMEIDMVYGASKYLQKTEEAPAVITTIDAQEIEDFGYTTLSQVLDSLRGFYSTYDRNYQYTGVRGFGRPGDYNSRFLVLIDGNRLNENIYGSAIVGTGMPVDMNLVHRIEVIRGPSSSIYGTSAVFGVINIITKNGHEIHGVDAQLDVGSFGMYQGRLSIGSRTDSGLEWLFSGTTGRRNGEDLYFPEFDDPATNNGVAQDGDFAEWQQIFGKASYNNFHIESAFNWSRKVIPTAPWGTVFNDNRTQTTDNLGYVSAWYEGPVFENTTLLARTSYNINKYEGAWVYDYAENPGDSPDIVLSMDDTKGKWLNTEIQLIRNFRKNLKISSGLEHRQNFQQDQRVWDADPYWSYLDDERNSSNWGAYLQGDWSIIPDVILNFGVRYDDYPTFGGTTNPRAALVTKPWEKTIFKLLYGSAFRAPNLYEMYYHDNAVTTKQNPNLLPENITTLELAWDQQLTDDLHSVVSLFNYEISDLIDQIIDPSDDLLVFQNSPGIHARGIEMELNGRYRNGWAHRFSYSYQYSDYEEENGNMTNSPRHLVKLNLVAPLHSRDFRAGLEVQYSSQRMTYFSTSTDGFVLTNLTLSKEFLWTGVKLRGSVRNLFDVDYYHPGGTEHYQDSLWQDGRSFRLTIGVAR